MSYNYYVNKRKPIYSWMLNQFIIGGGFHDTSGGITTDGESEPLAGFIGGDGPLETIGLVDGVSHSSLFGHPRTGSPVIGYFENPIFKRGQEDKPFVLECWIQPVINSYDSNTDDPISILSRAAAGGWVGEGVHAPTSMIYDGLVLEGNTIVFSTKYETEGTARCEYNMGVYKKCHIVAVHSASSNELWVNNELVASVAITEAQQGDLYVENLDDSVDIQLLWAGVGDNAVAIGAVSLYSHITTLQIEQNFRAGMRCVPRPHVASQFDGVSLNLSHLESNKFVERTWSTRADFEQGQPYSVQYDSDRIVQSYSAGSSNPGGWLISVPLDFIADDGADITNVYGLSVDWVGKGISVDVGVNNTSYSLGVSNGYLVDTIPNNSDVTGLTLWILVNFEVAQLETDGMYPSVLESIRVRGFMDSSINTQANRTITASYPAVVRNDCEPNELRDDLGVQLNGGTLTISADTTPDSDEFNIARTVEVLIKPLDIFTPPTINIDGDWFQNGIEFGSLELEPNQWQLITVVGAADFTGDITISGACIVGQVNIYPTALTSEEVFESYLSWDGVPPLRIENEDIGTDAFLIEEAADPVDVYSYKWSIISVG